MYLIKFKSKNTNIITNKLEKINMFFVKKMCENYFVEKREAKNQIHGEIRLTPLSREPMWFQYFTTVAEIYEF